VTIIHQAEPRMLVKSLMQSRSDTAGLHHKTTRLKARCSVQEAQWFIDRAGRG